MTILAVCLALAGCEEDKKLLMANPEVIDVGEYAGCKVQFVDRGYATRSFFIARCGETTTTTNNAMVQSGKTQILQRRTTIETKIKELEDEKSALSSRESALNKLTPEEAKALGISKN